MKTVCIQRSFEMKRQEHKLHFEGNLPLTVNYCRVGSDDAAQSGVYYQMNGIYRMLNRKFGRDSFDAIWVIERDVHSSSGIEEDSGLTDGLAFAVDLIENGYGQYLAVASLDRITRKLRVLDEIGSSILGPRGIELLVASDYRRDADPDLLDALAIAGGWRAER